MKKLTYLISAIAAGFTASAHADVSVSGSGSATYISNQANDGIVTVGTDVSFGLSTTTANGMVISTSLALSQDPDADGGPAGDGGQAISFATGGSTITVGDVEISDTPGSVGGVVGGVLDDNSALNSDVETAFDDDDGTGVTLSTAVGGATLTVGYIADLNTNDRGNIDAAAAETATSAVVSMPMGGFTLTAGIGSTDTESSSGASVAYAMGGGTLTVGYMQADLTAALEGDATADDLAADGQSSVLGATYKMALDADTSLALGYANKKDGDSESVTQTELALSRSLGGGASVFIEMQNLSGDATADGTAIAFGTSVSF
jgi:hypothetical protein